MKPSNQRKVGISEQGAGRGRELLTAVFVEADVEPRATVGLVRVTGLGAGLADGCSRTLVLCDVLVAAGRAAHDAIRPAHTLDVVKALVVGRKLYEDFG